MKKLFLLILLALAVSVPSQAQRAKASLTASTTDCSVAASCLTTYVTNTDGGATFTISGTFSATVQFEATGDGGTSWVALSVTPSNSTSSVTSATAAGTWQANVSGYTGIRVRVSAFVSGTVVASIGLSTASAKGGSGSSAGAVVYPSSANFVFDGDSRMCGSGSTSGCGTSPVTIASNGYVATTTGTASASSTTLTIASGTGTVNGQAVFGVGIAPGSTISSGGGTTTIILSAATVAALSTTTVNFGNTDPASQAMRLTQFSGRGTGYNLGVSGNTCGQVSARYTTDAHTFSPAVTGKTGYFFLNCGTNSEGPVTPTATGTNGQSTIVVSSTTGVEIGDTVTGTGIGAAAVIANTWNGTTTVPLTVANSGTVSGTMTITPSGASIAAAIMYVASLAKADGYTVFVTTNPMHVATSAQRNLNDTYNNLLRGYQGYYTGLVDLQALLVDTYDTNYYYATDSTHFVNEGYAVWAQSFANALILPGGFVLMPERRFANIGTGSNNYRGNDTAMAAQISASNNSCAGYACMPAVTTGGLNTAFGFSPLPVLVGGTFNNAFGNGSGANIVSGTNNSNFACSPSGDFSGTTCIGANSSNTGSFGTAVGYNTTAAASAMALGVGSSATSSGSVEIDPVNSATCATVNAGCFESATPFIDAAGYLYGTNKKFVTADFTDSTSTTLTIITGLSWTLPTSRAVNMSFHCSLLFDQATAAVSDSFGVGVTGTAPTQANASGTVFTSASVTQTGTLTALASTTPTAVVTFTPSAITTVWKAELDGTIEQPSNATPGVFSIYAATTTGADNLIVKRGSYCSLF